MIQRIQDLPADLQENINKIIKKEGYEKFDLKITDLNSAGNNFLGNLYEIDIKGETGNGKTETNLFVKVIIHLEKINLICVEDVYMNEVFLYNDLAKIFKVLQEEANIPIKERYNTVKSFDETNSNVIILENLSRNSFKTYSRFDVMPLKFAQLAIQQLAKFHGMSFVMEKKMPGFYNKQIKSMKHRCYYNDDFKSMVTKNCKYIANLFSDDKKRKVEKFISTIIEKLPKFNTDTTSFKCCLTHGDYKINNILVRETGFEFWETVSLLYQFIFADWPYILEELITTGEKKVVERSPRLNAKRIVEGEAVEVIPVDYQLMDYGCAIRDFLFFIFTGTDQEFRRKHLQDLKEMYFDTLTKFLKYFKIDVEDVYPRKEFERAYSEYLEFGLMTFMFGAVFIFASEEGLDVKTLSLSELPFKPTPEFEERTRDMIDDFIEWGCL